MYLAESMPQHQDKVYSMVILICLQCVTMQKNLSMESLVTTTILQYLIGFLQRRTVLLQMDLSMHLTRPLSTSVILELNPRV